MDKDMSYEESEKAIFNALRSAGMKRRIGGIRLMNGILNFRGKIIL